MALLACVTEALRRERMPYVVLHHPPAYTAQEVAAVSHTPGRCAVKVVICIADGQPLQALVPAHYQVDFDLLRAIARCETLRMANEQEIAGLYPDFEVGAAPPFGTLYGHRVFVEKCFVGEPAMVFSAGTHTQSLCMHYGDFADLVKPVVGVFGVRPAAARRSAPPPAAAAV